MRRLMVHPFFYTLKNYIYIHNYNMYNIIYNNKYTCNFIYTPTFLYTLGFPHGSEGKRICPQCRRPRFDPWVGKIPWRREWPHPGILAWRIQWREEAGGLQSMGSQRVGHDWATKLFFLNMPCFVHLNKRAKKRRAFKRLLGDKNSNFSSALWEQFLYYFFPYRFLSSWAKLGLWFLKTLES